MHSNVIPLVLISTVCVPYLWQSPEFCHTIILYCGGLTKGASTEDLAEKKLIVLPEVKRVNINFTIMQMLARIIDKTEA